MLDWFKQLFVSKQVDPDLLFALEWRRPDKIEVLIKKSDEGYFARITNLEGNVVTQASNGMELIEMVNEAMYDYLDIPTQYRAELGYFMPPHEVREELKLEVPKKYLNATLSMQRA